MKRSGTTISCLLFTLALPTSALPGEVLLHPTQDNTLIENATGSISNGSGQGIFVGNNASEVIHRAVLTFDVTASVPPGSTLVSIELRLNVSSAPNSTPRTVTVHRLNAPWGEGASIGPGGRGAPATPGDATWYHTFYPDQLWSSPGGDFESTASATTTVGETGLHAWSGPGLMADVQHWLDAPETNFGWLLRGEEVGASTARSFDSRESDCEECRPLLVLHFAPDPVGVKEETWGHVKARFGRQRVH